MPVGVERLPDMGDGRVHPPTELVRVSVAVVWGRVGRSAVKPVLWERCCRVNGDFVVVRQEAAHLVVRGAGL